MNELRQSREYARLVNYGIINNSQWFNALAGRACQNSERSGNRLYIYFKSYSDAEQAIQECKSRNISYIGTLYDSLDDTYRLDIMMNWKENRPTKANRKLDLILD